MVIPCITQNSYPTNGLNYLLCSYWWTRWFSQWPTHNWRISDHLTEHQRLARIGARVMPVRGWNSYCVPAEDQNSKWTVSAHAELLAGMFGKKFKCTSITQFSRHSTKETGILRTGRYPWNRVCTYNRWYWFPGSFVIGMNLWNSLGPSYFTLQKLELLVCRMIQYF